MSPRANTHVNTTDRTDHLGDDDHVSQVSLDGGGLLVGSGLLLGLSELLDQSQGLPLETSLEPSPGTGVDELQDERAKRAEQNHQPRRSHTFRLQVLCRGAQTHVDELFILQVQKLVQLDPSVSVLLESTLPLQLGGLGGVGKSGISLEGRANRNREREGVSDEVYMGGGEGGGSTAESTRRERVGEMDRRLGRFGLRERNVGYAFR